MCWNQREVNNIADVDCLVKKYELQLYGKPTIFTEDSVKIFGMISDLCWQGSQQFYRVLGKKYELAGTYIGNFEANNFYRVLGKNTN